MTYQFKYNVEFCTDTSTVAVAMRDEGWSLANLEAELPQPRYTFVEIPGKDGALDLSRAVSGSMNYGQGKYTLTFEKDVSMPAFVTQTTTIVTTLHGKKYLVRLQINSASGRTYLPSSSKFCEVAVTKWESHPHKTVITVECIY